jgi:exodeoxyribonuclease-5
MTRPPQHEAALRAIDTWWRGRGRTAPQVFRLFGWAGTGKTTLAKVIAETITGTVAFAAYTGKAALVMQAQGCRGATTLHSLIYSYIEEVDKDGRTRSRFRLNPGGPASRADLFIIDECSMVGRELGVDLLSFGKPVLVLGDPFQLPPVEGAGFFTEAKPDMMLTEVHRQAADDPIVQLATRIRMGKTLMGGRYGASQVISPTGLDLAAVFGADQTLVGTNDLRRRLNRRFRKIEGRYDDAPAVGDRLVCLRNNRAKALLNGSLWMVDEVRASKPDGLDRLYVTSNDAVRDGVARRLAIVVPHAFFTGTEEELSDEQKQRCDAFTYSNALTVHKAQGSQWDNVVLFDESTKFQNYAQRWLYVGITRAVKSITIVSGSVPWQFS